MILRRAVEHAKAQNWFAVALDFVIVVVGVFFAIEVANWNQSRQDRQEERRYYGQLLVDLRADLDTLMTAQRRADLHDDAAQLVIERLSGKAPFQASRGQMATAIHIAGFINIPHASRGTYDELINTGNLGLLRNSQLKSRIAHYYGAFERDRQWDSLLRDQQSDYWADTAGILPRPILRAATRGTEPLVTAEDDQKIWQRARSHARLPNMLIGMAAHQERVRRDCERHAVQATRLIADIERYLNEGA